MKIPRPVLASAALGTTLLLGACFGGQPSAPAPVGPPVSSVPAHGTPSPNTPTAPVTPSTIPTATPIAPPAAPPAIVPQP